MRSKRPCPRHKKNMERQRASRLKRWPKRERESRLIAWLIAEQLAAREAKLKDMESKLEAREKEFKFWMDERTDEMLEYARKTIEKDFQPPPTPLRAQTTSTETQMTPARRTNSTTTPWTAPAVTPQRTRRQPPPPPPPPNRNITFDDPFDVDNDEEEEDDEEYDEEASMGGWSRPKRGLPYPQ